MATFGPRQKNSRPLAEGFAQTSADGNVAIHALLTTRGLSHSDRRSSPEIAAHRFKHLGASILYGLIKAESF